MKSEIEKHIEEQKLEQEQEINVNYDNENLFQLDENDPLIRDKEAFYQWKKYYSNPILKLRIHTCSDGIQLDLAQISHRLRAKINHLPIEERNRIEKIKSFWHIEMRKEN